jgi:hypothetical protein
MEPRTPSSGEAAQRIFLESRVAPSADEGVRRSMVSFGPLSPDTAESKAAPNLSRRLDHFQPLHIRKMPLVECRQRAFSFESGCGDNQIRKRLTNVYTPRKWSNHHTGAEPVAAYARDEKSKALKRRNVQNPEAGKGNDAPDDWDVNGK